MSWFDQNPPPSAGTITPSGSAAPVAAGTDYQSYFNSLFPGGSLSSDQLWAQKDALAQQGITVMTNGEGVHGKVKLPNGEIVDVIGGSGSGQNIKQWNSDHGVRGGGNGLPQGYSLGMMTGGGQYPLSSFNAPGLIAPWTTPFQAPTGTDDPGWEFRRNQAQQALERSAASKGTLLTGGTLRDMADYMGGMASQEYGNAYNRKLGEYQMAYGIYGNNQANAFNRLGGVASIGENAAANTGNAASSFAQNGGNTLTGIGNSLGAGQAASGGAWANGVQGAGNAAAGGLLGYSWYHQPTAAPYGGYNMGAPVQAGTSYGYTPGTAGYVNPSQMF